jgi:hypothetical protein
MSKEFFIINNLEDFVNATRRLVFKNFGTNPDEDLNLEDIITNSSPQDESEMNNVLSYSESCSIVKSFIKKQTNKKTKENRYVLDEEIYMSIVMSLNDRLVSNILNGLVNKGLVETAYDDKTNDFVFWITDEYKENIKKDTESPETD